MKALFLSFKHFEWQQTVKILNVYQKKTTTLSLLLSDAIGMKARNMKNDTVADDKDSSASRVEWKLKSLPDWDLSFSSAAKKKEKPPNKLLLSFLCTVNRYDLFRWRKHHYFELFPRLELCTDKESDENMQKDRKERRKHFFKFYWL